MPMTTVDMPDTRTTPVRCPACQQTFACDACLHVHLVRRYNTRYADVFGRTPEAFVAFCERHADCSPAMLGL